MPAFTNEPESRPASPVLQTPPVSEWLLTNGRAGFAMGCRNDADNRRYHAWWIEPLAPPDKRHVILQAPSDQLQCAGRTFDLSCHTFQLDDDDTTVRRCDERVPPPEIVIDGPSKISWRWTIEYMIVTRSLELEQKHSCANLTWSVEGAPAASRLVVRPFVQLRPMHDLEHAHDDDAARCSASRIEDHCITMQRDDMLVRIDAKDGAWKMEPQWWKRFALTTERSRGQDWVEDRWSPGEVTWHLWSSGRQTVSMRVSLVEPSRRIHTAIACDTNDALDVAASQFVVRADDGQPTILAGYPWFGSWGRDTMICIPGLLLARGLTDDAADVLMHYADHLKDGLIPNWFDDGTAAAEYNTVDASLWFVHVAGLVLKNKTIAKQVRTRLTRACSSIVDAYQNGTRYGIGMDEADGLITQGEEGYALTWMDAVHAGECFTPRRGKAVEINALWHRALGVLSDNGEDAAVRDDAALLRERVKRSFNAMFWCDERGWLRDVVVGDDEVDSKVQMRPNQLFAASLPGGLLSTSQSRSMLQAVRSALLTPAGLRTLAPDDPAYVGRYEGDMRSRDAAYHQGTVWPWLLGAYVEGWWRAAPNDSLVKAGLSSVIANWTALMDGGVTGQIAEIYDGDAPHKADGCPAQAWSVAELLRVRHLFDEDG